MKLLGDKYIKVIDKTIFSHLSSNTQRYLENIPGHVLPYLYIDGDGDYVIKSIAEDGNKYTLLYVPPGYCREIGDINA